MAVGLKSLILPYTRAELPGWGWLLNRIGKIDYLNDALWADVPTQVIRGKWHGYEMPLDMTDWSGRHTYFLGRYYELGTQLLLTEVLRPGDRVLDIGANIGMIALHAAHLVGPEGRVDCFEPNPVCVAAIEDLISRNDIRHIHLYRCGLAEEDAVLELKQDHAHTGIGTFADRDPDEVVKTTQAQVRRGDDVFADDDRPARFVKIDVEGFELHVVKGLEETLKRWGPMVLMEMEDAHLERAGTSCREITEFMQGIGFSATGVRTRRQGLRHRLDLVPISDAAELVHFVDVLWRPTATD